MIETLAFGIGHWEIVVIVLVIALLFGTTKIPALMRNMGSGLSEFKKGLKQGEKEAEEEDKAEKSEGSKMPGVK